VQARKSVDAWLRTKQRAQDADSDVSAALHDLIIAAEPAIFD
jgi:hypothetical protein